MADITMSKEMYNSFLTKHQILHGVNREEIEAIHQAIQSELNLKSPIDTVHIV